MNKKTTNKKTTRKRAPKKKQNLIKVQSPIKKDAAFFVATELADDALIEKEVLGQTTKTMVYELEQTDGTVVRGLSYQGVREAVRVINRMRNSGHTIQISDRPPIIDRNVSMNGQEGVEVQVYGVDIQAGGGSWGIKFEPWNRYIHGSHGNMEFNRFALETALSKAQRNALFNLLPAHLIEQQIEKFAKDKKNVAKIEAPKVETRVQKATATGDDKMYIATLERVGTIKDNKKQLKETLAKVEKMPLTSKQKSRVKTKINGYLRNKKWNKKLLLTVRR